MKVPNSVVWQIVKKNNAYLVKRGKCGDQFTKDPLSITNRHNATDNGLVNDKAISIQSRKEGAKKTHRRVFDVNIKHDGHHSAKKHSGAVYSKQSVKKEVNHLAKTINSLKGISDKHRNKLLKRVHRLHTGNKLHQKKKDLGQVANN